jgi:hypothetical protein
MDSAPRGWKPPRTTRKEKQTPRSNLGGEEMT